MFANAWRYTMVGVFVGYRRRSGEIVAGTRSMPSKVRNKLRAWL